MISFFVFAVSILTKSEFSFASDILTHPNHRLINSVFQTLQDSDWLACIEACAASPRCLSYNYRKPTEFGENGVCELNDAGYHDPCEAPEKYLTYDSEFVFQQLRSKESQTPQYIDSDGAKQVVTLPLKNSTSLLGSELKLTCSNPMQWTKDNSTSIPRVLFNDDKAELVIESTEAGDAGLYECVGTIEGRLVKSATMVHVQEKPGRSCLHINKTMMHWGDGEYWIEPEFYSSGAEENPFLVHCDMTTAQGGWILIQSIKGPVNESISSILSQDYRAISEFANSSVYPVDEALFQLKKFTNFTQLRWYCRKKDKSFHIMTAQNSSGEAVVKFFVEDRSTYPKACGSFIRFPDDNSFLASNCLNWGGNATHANQNEWGNRGNIMHGRRVYRPVWTTKYKLQMFNSLKCDDNGGSLSIGDEFSLYVR